MAASNVGSPVEKGHRIEMAIASCDKALELARSTDDVGSARLCTLLLGRVAACLQLAALSFGSEHSKALYEFARMDTSAALEIDPLETQALLLRARASIALACSDFIKEDAERDLRLKDAARDLNIIRAIGTATGNTKDMHAAATWAKAARIIAERFTPACKLSFPCVTAEVIQLVMRLECEATPSLPVDENPSRQLEIRERPKAAIKVVTMGAWFVECWKMCSSFLLALQWHSDHVRLVNIGRCGLGAVLTLCLIMLVPSTSGCVPSSSWEPHDGL